MQPNRRARLYLTGYPLAELIDSLTKERPVIWDADTWTVECFLADLEERCTGKVYDVSQIQTLNLEIKETRDAIDLLYGPVPPDGPFTACTFAEWTGDENEHCAFSLPAVNLNVDPATKKVWLSIRATLKTGAFVTFGAGWVNVSFSGAGNSVGPPVTGGGTHYQPLDDDLTAIAALATTAYGRSVLTVANALAARTLFSAAAAVHQHAAADVITGTFNHARLGAGGGGAVKFLREDATWQSLSAALAAVFQPLDADLTAIAALTTTAFGRSILTLLDAAAARTLLGAAAAVHTHAGADIVSGTVNQARLGAGGGGAIKFLREDSTWQNLTTVLAAVYQPLDADLTAIAALTTTGYGRSVLALVDAAAARVLFSAAAAVHTHAAADVISGTFSHARLGSGGGTAIKFLREDSTWQDLSVALAAVFQPHDTDLTAIAALTTTPYGRSVLTVADAAAARALFQASSIGHTHAAADVVSGVFNQARLGTGGGGAVKFLREDSTWQIVATNFQPLDADLTAIAALATTAYGRSVLILANAAAARILFSAAAAVHTHLSADVTDASPAALPNVLVKYGPSGQIDAASVDGSPAVMARGGTSFGVYAFSPVAPAVRGESGGGTYVAEFVDGATEEQVFAVRRVDGALVWGGGAGTMTCPPGPASLYLDGSGTWSDPAGGVLSGTFRFAGSTVAGDPGNGSFRLNAATWATTTAIYFDQLSDAGTDVSGLLGLLQAGDVIVLQQKGDTSRKGRYNVTGPAVNNTGWFTIPVAVVATGTVLPNAGAPCAVVAIYSGGSGGGSGGGSYQPLDADLTAIAALITTAFGRSVLTILDAAAGCALFSAAAAVHVHSGADITSGTINQARLGSGGGGAAKFLREDNTWQNVVVDLSPAACAMIAPPLASLADARGKVGDMCYDPGTPQYLYRKIGTAPHKWVYSTVYDTL